MDLSYVIRNLFIFNHVSTYLLRSYRRWLSICTLLPGITAQPPVHHQDPALCGDMSDPYADGNGSKILPMFDPYADGKRQILPDVRSKQGAEMAGR